MVLGLLTVPAGVPLAVAAPTTTTATTSTAALAGQAGTYRAVSQLRVLDSRTGTGGPATALAPGEVRTVKVAGLGSVPATGVSAVAVNVGVLTPARAGSVTVFPGGTAWNGTGTVSFRAGVTVQSSLTAKLGGTGTLAFRNNTGAPLHLVADVGGYYLGGTPTAAGAFGALTMARVLDTRSGVGGPATAVAPGQTRTVTVSGHGGVPATGVAAVAVNVGVLAPGSTGSVAVFAGGTAWNGTGSISFVAGGTVQSSLTAKLGTGGTLAFRNNTGVSLQLIADVAGYYLAGPPAVTGGYGAIATTRVMDTRSTLQTSIAAGATLEVPASPVLTSDSKTLVPPSGVMAVSANVGVLNPAAAGSVSVYAGNTSWNRTGSISFPARVTVQSSLTSTLGVAGTLLIRNNTSAALDVIVDLAGYYFGQPAPVSFGLGEKVDPPHGAMLSLSCGSATSCVAVEGNGYVLVYDGQGWSPAQKVSTVATFNSVSCPTATFCMAMGRLTTGTGVASTFDGHSWSGPASLGTQPLAVSCTSATFCMAVDSSGGAHRYDGTTWSARTVIAEGLALREISCVSSSFCTALDTQASAAMYNGTSWSVIAAPTSSTTGVVVRRYVSCAAPTFCVAVGSGAAIVYDGNHWSAPVQIDAGRAMEGVSCPSPSWCMAIDHDGRAMRFDGQSWTAPAAIAAGTLLLGSISCSSVTSCVVVNRDNFERAYRFNGTSWGAPVHLDSVHGFPIAVSCASQDFCMLLDRWGGARSYTASGWGAWTEADPGVAVTALSCASSTFCVAVDEVGRSVTYTGSGWGQPVMIDGGRKLNSVSCAATTSCVAVDADGWAVSYDNGAWSQPAKIDIYELRRVSCASAQFCVAADNQGHVVTRVGTAWSQPAGTPLSNAVDLSCPSPSFCLMTSYNFNTSLARTAKYDGARWSSVPTNSYQAMVAVSCPAVAVCVGLDGEARPLALGFDGTNWSAPFVVLDPWMSGVVDVSCVPGGFCMAVGYYGYAARTTA
jgi:hypothetical protein